MKTSKLQAVLAAPITKANPSRAEMRSGFLTLAFSLLAAVIPSEARAASPPFDQDPVIFVHGCAFITTRDQWAAAGPQANEEYWRPMADGFRAAGYPADHVMTLTYSEPCADNHTNAAELALAVEELLARTGKSKVDLVGLSMGCLSTRLYARNARRVDDLVSLAGACHGADLDQGFKTAATLNGENPGLLEVDPAYTCAGVQQELNGCFDPLTGERVDPADETPGGVSVHSIYTDTDELVRPIQSACLDQAVRNDCSSPINFFVPGRSHFTIHQEPEVIDMVVDFVHDPPSH